MNGNEDINRQNQLEGNMTLEYVIRDTFKHVIWARTGLNPETEQNKRIEIQREALSALWALKSHPHYLAYPNSPDYALGELIPRFPSLEMVAKIENRVKIDDEYLYGKARMSRAPYDNRSANETTEIPEHNTIVKKGILTGVVAASGEEIRSVAIAEPHFQKLLSVLAERAQTTPETVATYLIAEFDYGLYTIGYALPYITAGTKAEARTLRDIIVSINQSSDFLKQKYKIDI